MAGASRAGLGWGDGDRQPVHRPCRMPHRRERRVGARGMVAESLWVSARGSRATISRARLEPQSYGQAGHVERRAMGLALNTDFPAAPRAPTGLSAPAMYGN
jgi:hypothetical protein